MKTKIRSLCLTVDPATLSLSISDGDEALFGAKEQWLLEKLDIQSFEVASIPLGELTVRVIVERVEE